MLTLCSLLMHGRALTVCAVLVGIVVHVCSQYVLLLCSLRPFRPFPLSCCPGKGHDEPRGLEQAPTKQGISQTCGGRVYVVMPHAQSILACIVMVHLLY